MADRGQSRKPSRIPSSSPNPTVPARPCRVAEAAGQSFRAVANGCRGADWRRGEGLRWVKGELRRRVLAEESSYSEAFTRGMWEQSVGWRMDDEDKREINVEMDGRREQWVMPGVGGGLVRPPLGTDRPLLHTDTTRFGFLHNKSFQLHTLSRPGQCMHCSCQLEVIHKDA
jgi:hypothetical protein